MNVKLMIGIICGYAVIGFSDTQYVTHAESQPTQEEKEAISARYVRMKIMLAKGKAYQNELRTKIEKEKLEQAEVQNEVFAKTKTRAAQHKIDKMEKELASVETRLIAMEVYLKEFERLHGLNRPPVRVRR